MRRKPKGIEAAIHFPGRFQKGINQLRLKENESTGVPCPCEQQRTYSVDGKNDLVIGKCRMSALVMYPGLTEMVFQSQPPLEA
jgi:hypothetical protein